MNLQQVKDTLNSAGFSEEALKEINQILDSAIKRGFLTEVEKTHLLGIIDVEIEAANLEADATEEVALALSSFASEVDTAKENALAEVDQADKDLLSEVKTIASQASS